jgi:hypothetical protein
MLIQVDSWLRYHWKVLHSDMKVLTIFRSMLLGLELSSGRPLPGIIMPISMRLLLAQTNRNKLYFLKKVSLHEIRQPHLLGFVTLEKRVYLQLQQLQPLLGVTAYAVLLGHLY